MNKTLIVIAAGLVLVGVTGCKSITASGDGWSLKENSFLWSTSNTSASVTSTNGIKTTFSQDNSSADQKTIQTLADATVNLAGKFAK
jgi:outer membrane lipoprotein SlyB